MSNISYAVRTNAYNAEGLTLENAAIAALCAMDGDFEIRPIHSQYIGASQPHTTGYRLFVATCWRFDQFYETSVHTTIADEKRGKEHIYEQIVEQIVGAGDKGIRGVCIKVMPSAEKA